MPTRNKNILNVGKLHTDGHDDCSNKLKMAAWPA